MKLTPAGRSLLAFLVFYLYVSVITADDDQAAEHPACDHLLTCTHTHTEK